MPGVKAATASRDLTAELAFLTRALKAPTLRESVSRLAERARAESWSHEEYLAACLQREVAARDAHGGEGRIKAARFPARKSLEEFDFDHARGLIGEVSVMRPGIGLDRGFSVVSGDGLVAEPMRRPVLVLPPSTRRGPGPALGTCPTEGRTMRNRQRASTPLESTTNSNRRLVMNYVGFDWASRAHDVTVLDEAGGVLDRWAFPHSETGWVTTLDRLARHGSAAEVPVIIGAH